MSSCSPTNPCPGGYPSAECVVYTGENIPCFNILTNDRLDVIIQKIAAVVCGASLSVTTTTSTTQLRFVARWGWSDVSPTTESNITALQGTGSFNHNTTVNADFRANSSPKYLIMAEPLTEPLKTKWYGTDLNKGNVGGSDDFFGPPLIISSWRVYVSAYPSQQQDTVIQFKVS